MIRNIIFDIGNILIDFKPIEFLKSFTNDSEIIEKFFEKVFFSKTWLNLDRGILSWKDAKQVFITQHPDEKTLIEFLFKNWRKILTPIEKNILFLKYLKQKGYFIYVLSNIIEDLFIYLRNQYDFFSLLDGQILSFQEKFIKPEIQIYQILLDRYNLIPNESLYLDDHNSCLEQAIKLGMYTMLIKPETDIKAEFKKLGFLN